MDASISHLRLWQLISPALPIGAYAYSQGLEYAVDQAWVSDEASVQRWIAGVASNSVACLDLPVLARMYKAWSKSESGDENEIIRWSRFLLASRESAEVLAEDRHLGQALAKLLTDLEIAEADAWRQNELSNFPAMFSLAAHHWQVPIQQTLSGYLWAWSENQVAAAIKLVPLGQTAGQRILSHLIERIPTCVDEAMTCEDEEIGVLCPGVAMASAKHETQYSRLFRS